MILNGKSASLLPAGGETRKFFFIRKLYFLQVTRFSFVEKFHSGD
ncbi:hypothetical protein LEP1GSC021_4046 [Leptospira noguchii str. 1993005606]|nr:hypothetical protein LEP1GSC021_4046 [Leptospira noguchii str. 1993005606]